MLSVPEAVEYLIIILDKTGDCGSSSLKVMWLGRTWTNHLIYFMFVSCKSLEKRSI